MLHAAFTPKRLGAATSVRFSINIDPPAASEPPPLIGLDVTYPKNLGFATSGLGLAACDPVQLQAQGAQVCPANAKVGAGNATVQVAFGADIVTEHVTLGLFAGPSNDGYLHVLILATGTEPVEARIVMSGVLLPGHLQIAVPEVPGLPGAGDVAITRMQATLGGALTYYERRHGRLHAYRPAGIGLPSSCPRGGWRLGASLAFIGGAHSQASDVIGCPGPSGH